MAGSPNRPLFGVFYLIWVYLVLFVRSASIWTSHVICGPSYLKSFVRSGALHYLRDLIRSGRWLVGGTFIWGKWHDLHLFFIVFRRDLCSEVKVLKTFCIYPRAEIDFFYNFFYLGLLNRSKKANLTVAATSSKRAANPLESRKIIEWGIFIIFI